MSPRLLHGMRRTAPVSTIVQAREHHSRHARIDQRVVAHSGQKDLVRYDQPPVIPDMDNRVEEADGLRPELSSVTLSPSVSAAQRR